MLYEKSEFITLDSDGDFFGVCMVSFTQCNAILNGVEA